MSFAMYNPSNALRRADDFESAGDKSKALDHLYEVLTSRKIGRQWQPAHEVLVVKFIDLCVDFRESRKCKEGLYFYRNLAAQQNPQSLEKIITYLIELSMKKAAEARARTDSMAQLETLEDLESEEQSPEALLMGGVTSEGSRERTEREVLVPWVRHMWDTFRNILEILRSNQVLELLYHGVAMRAMSFCKQYNRGTEFKKLCNTLRGHWSKQKEHADYNGKPISQETVERHMATRFVQLEHCASMSLWNEGFRTIHDIREIMEDTSYVPKQQMMASYYEKLARIFWVSENYLFHAYSWYRFVNLLLSRNQSLTDDDRRNLATAVVLAAISIPIYAAGPAGSGASYNTAQAVDPLAVDSDRKKKHELAALLRTPQQPVLTTLPTREALLAELNSKRILTLVRPEAAALYQMLENDFSPLTIVQRAQPLLAWVQAQKGPTLPSHVQIIGGSNTGAHTLSQYVPNLERLLVFRLLEQLSTVYSTVMISNFQALIAGLRMSFFDVEKLAVRAMKLRQLAVRIDHRAGVIRLGTESQETPSTRRQLTSLASRLQVVSDTLQPQVSEGSIVPNDRREQLFHFARIHSEPHRLEMHRRHIVVRRRRDDAETAASNARKNAEIERQEQLALLQKNEAERIQREERERLEAERQEILRKEEQKRMDALLEQATAAHLNVSKLAAQFKDQAALQRAVNEKLLKAREEEVKRRSEQGRKVDYLIRALRETERPKVEALLKATMERHANYVTKYNTETLATKKATYEQAMENKVRIAKMMPYAEIFENNIMGARENVYAASKAARELTEKIIFLKQKLENARQRRDQFERRAAEELASRAAQEEETRRREDAENRRQQQEAERQSTPVPDASPSSSLARPTTGVYRPGMLRNLKAQASSSGSSGTGVQSTVTTTTISSPSSTANNASSSSSSSGGDPKIVGGIKFTGERPRFIKGNSSTPKPDADGGNSTPASTNNTPSANPNRRPSFTNSPRK